MFTIDIILILYLKVDIRNCYFFILMIVEKISGEVYLLHVDVRDGIYLLLSEKVSF